MIDCHLIIDIFLTFFVGKYQNKRLVALGEAWPADGKKCQRTDKIKQNRNEWPYMVLMRCTFCLNNFSSEANCSQNTRISLSLIEPFRFRSHNYVLLSRQLAFVRTVLDLMSFIGIFI